MVTFRLRVIMGYVSRMSKSCSRRVNEPLKDPIFRVVAMRKLEFRKRGTLKQDL